MFGSHLSIAGSMHKALLRAEELGMACLQVFTKNQQQWHSPPLSEEQIGNWAAHRDRLKMPTVSHDSYLINLASPDAELLKKSRALFCEELRRCETLKIPYLVTHPGAHMGEGEAKGLKAVATSLDHCLASVKGQTIVCLESTAGMGSSLGHQLEHLAEIIEQCKQADRLAVCLDTAHLFAAGYDLRGEKNYAAFRKRLSKLIGLKRVRVWHINDSKIDLGKRVDRHDHIGLGKIGDEGFRPIVRDTAWKKTPKIMETPKDKSPDGRDWDTVNIERLQSLM